jgi:aspartate/methionine/tyrosine aminotransferase
LLLCWLQVAILVHVQLQLFKWDLPWRQLESAFILVNTPHNPTGKVSTTRTGERW